MNANPNIEDYFIQDEISDTYLHYYIKLKNDIVCRDYLDVNKLNSSLRETLKYMTYYQKGMHNKYLTKDYGLGGSSPYILTITMYYNGEKFWTNILSQKDKKKTKRIVLNKRKHRKYFIENKIDKNKVIECFNRIEQHFLQARKYLVNKRDIYNLSKLRIFLVKNLNYHLIKNEAIKRILIDKYLKQKKDKKEVSVEIRVYIDVGLKRVKHFYEKFVEQRAFLNPKEAGIYKGTCPICKRENVELSLPYFLSTMGDDFGMKLTMPLKITNAICKTCTLKLHKFKVMTDNNQLTKPFPLFIDKKNLFGEQKSILNDNEKKKSYKEMIKAIYYTNPKDLKNFYLLYYISVNDNGWKLKIKDIDYIENFQYMTDIVIENFLDLKNSFILNDFYNKLLSVFQFEKVVNDLIFENKMQKNYFSDYKDFEFTYPNSKNKNSLLKNYFLKYRQDFYDFIYKSRFNALKQIDFKEMLLDIIEDNIRHDEKDKNSYSIYENSIKEKINFLFSIEKFLQKENRLQSDELKYLKEKMKENIGYWQEYQENNEAKKRFVGGRDNLELNEENDKFFAFLVGQFARFLLSKSKAKSENLTHAAFAGFLDWNCSKLLKNYVLEVFSKYAHEIKYSSLNGKVENAISIIETYKDDLEMDKVKEYLIAGYFADNYFYEKKEIENE